ncbi:putative nucleic acid-binding Zn ribbon protein [Novosphingobium sp. SG751A]|uniref:hypothetical protein n=1 Tax=Novosphingobium sp. SG751A TaxID=2587000 RepID=UPI001554DA74|nr:hypothetical protein [Novosphingobium sp. SG751A]NOW48621.1 putative nucleic acid-binding Zn ribbon protein [Novosphingobium sp. SG751A]
MNPAGISMDQIVALIAVALMLMLVWRNLSSYRLSRARKLGMAMLWVAAFGLIALLSAQFGL